MRRNPITAYANKQSTHTYIHTYEKHTHTQPDKTTHPTNNIHRATCMMGDFGQAAPISENDNPVRLAFQSTIWNNLAAKTIVLSEPHNGIQYTQRANQTTNKSTRNMIMGWCKWILVDFATLKGCISELRRS